MMIISDSRPAYTLEITGKAIQEIVAAQELIPTGTPVNIAFLGNEDHGQRIEAARLIRACGLEPVPILSSRRFLSQEDRDHLIEALIEAAAPSRFLLVGGDPSSPAGPYQDSLALLKSGIVARHGLSKVGIVGYPQGHHKIDEAELWRCLCWKLDFLQEAGCDVEITTQFGLDPQAFLDWIEHLRGYGIDVPVRIGVPGPAKVSTLLRFAKQFGIATSASILGRYGLSMANLVSSAGPDRFWEALDEGMKEPALGDVLFHLYPFGGIEAAVRWMTGVLSPNLKR
ncbi:MAG: hypothetical protein OIF58_09985 [Cohaesibacter sp.]|nr:hypothetical protein [Cohaesibacter sp.]